MYSTYSFRRIQLDNDPRGNDSSVMDDPIYIGIVPTSK